jgi:hypothetical protein
MIAYIEVITAACLGVKWGATPITISLSLSLTVPLPSTVNEQPGTMIFFISDQSPEPAVSCLGAPISQTDQVN